MGKWYRQCNLDQQSRQHQQLSLCMWSHRLPVVGEVILNYCIWLPDRAGYHGNPGFKMVQGVVRVENRHTQNVDRRNSH